MLKWSGSHLTAHMLPIGKFFAQPVHYPRPLPHITSGIQLSRMPGPVPRRLGNPGRSKFAMYDEHCGRRAKMFGSKTRGPDFAGEYAIVHCLKDTQRERDYTSVGRQDVHCTAPHVARLRERHATRVNSAPYTAPEPPFGHFSPGGVFACLCVLYPNPTTRPARWTPLLSGWPAR